MNELRNLEAGDHVTEPGLYDLSNTRYHQDPVEGGSLSASGAKTLLRSPAHYRYEREHPTFKEAYDIGSAAHKYVLSDERELIVEIDADDWKLKATREDRDAARAEGMIPLLTHQHVKVKAMAEALLTHPIAKHLFTPGQGLPEPSLFAEDSLTGTILRCKPDWLPNSTNGRLIVPDYKTAIDARKDAFEKALGNYGYYIQAPFYLEIIRALELGDEPAFVFVVQEKDPPYLVNVFEPDVIAVERGRQQARKAIDLFTHCVANDSWGGGASYPEEVQLIGLPIWQERKLDEEGD